MPTATVDKKAEAEAGIAEIARKVAPVRDGNFPLYARLCLKIQTMEGELVPFEVNEVQEVLTDIFGHILYWIGVRYNQAWVVPERNNHGLIAVNKLIELGYPKLYAERVIEPPHKPRKRYGWHTGSSKGHGKYAIIDNLAAELRDDQHGIRCAGTFAEMITFKQGENGELGAEEGFHDDRVMSYAIAKWVRRKLPLPNAQAQRQEHFFRAAEEEPAAVSVNAW